MPELKHILEYANNVLSVDQYNDYGPNGLQVEGRREIKSILAGVSASQALIDEAVRINADMLLVHHGYFWRGESPVLTGIKRKRIQTLLSHEINLVAYHLPLDAHPELGNNAQLALKLDMQVEQRFDLGGAIGIGYQGQLKTAMDADQFASHLERKLGRKPVYVKGNDKKILSIAWCSGGAQSYFDEVISRGVDAYLTGEASEYNFHSAMENQVNFFSAGHHATERYGVQALAELLVKKFDLTYSFFDQENPI